MIDFLLDGANLPFSVSLGIMLGIGLLEGLGSLIGLGFSNLLDSMVPDLDADIDLDIDLDTGAPADPDLDGLQSPMALSQLLGWFHVGRTPVLILLILFLFSFGAGGLVVQYTAGRLFGSLWPGIVAAGPALVIALGFVKVAGGVIGRLIPSDETEAVSMDSLIGREATIVIGRAEYDKPAQAKLKDEFGKSHYVMIKPAEQGLVFLTGQKVLVIDREDSVFTAVTGV